MKIILLLFVLIIVFGVSAINPAIGILGGSTIAVFYYAFIRPIVRSIEKDNERSINRGISNTNEENKKGKYVISKNSNKYHKVNCKFAKSIAEENRIYFESLDSIDSSKYKSCNFCNPSN